MTSREMIQGKLPPDILPRSGKMPLTVLYSLKGANWEMVLFIPVHVVGTKRHPFAPVSYIVQLVLHIFRAYKIEENISPWGSA